MNNKPPTTTTSSMIPTATCPRFAITHNLLTERPCHFAEIENEQGTIHLFLFLQPWQGNHDRATARVAPTIYGVCPGPHGSHTCNRYRSIGLIRKRHHHRQRYIVQ